MLYADSLGYMPPPVATFEIFIYLVVLAGAAIGTLSIALKVTDSIAVSS